MKHFPRGREIEHKTCKSRAHRNQSRTENRGGITRASERSAAPRRGESQSRLDRTLAGSFFENRGRLARAVIDRVVVDESTGSVKMDVADLA